MVWFRVDDTLTDHPKMLKLQSKAGWQGALSLWTLAGAWSSKHLTDGSVPEAVVTRLGCQSKDAALLVECKLWERTAEGFKFHNWDKRNPSKTDVETKRERTRNKVTEWRRNRVTERVTNQDVTEGCNPAPIPSHPIPSQLTPQTPLSVFDSNTLRELFSQLRTGAGGGRLQKIDLSDYDRAQTAVDWAREEDPEHPELAAQKSIANYLAHADEFWRKKQWPFSGWAKDPGGWFAFQPPAAAEPVDALAEFEKRWREEVPLER